MRNLRWLLILAFVVSTPVHAGTITVPDSRIVEVTVYPDRAEIVREARVVLPAGSSTVDLTDLPWQLDAESLRVSAKGTPAVLGAVELRVRSEARDETPDTVTLDAIASLEKEIRSLHSGEVTTKELREFLTS